MKQTNMSCSFILFIFLNFHFISYLFILRILNTFQQFNHIESSIFFSDLTEWQGLEMGICTQNSKQLFSGFY